MDTIRIKQVTAIYGGVVVELVGNGDASLLIGKQVVDTQTITGTGALKATGLGLAPVEIEVALGGVPIHTETITPLDPLTKYINEGAIAWLAGQGIDIDALRLAAEDRIIEDVAAEKAEIAAKRDAELAKIEREKPVFIRAEPAPIETNKIK